MFSKIVIRTDAFLDMPLSTQALYFHLGLEADDEGFVSSPKQVQRSIGASPDDFKVLVAKGFIIPFESGVCVIRDWKVNNYLRSDRYKPTQYLREKSQIETLSNRVYQLNSAACLPLGIPTVNHVVDEVDTQYRVDKNRLEENRVVKGSAEGTDKPPRRTKFSPPSVEEVQAYITERGCKVDAERFVDFYTANGWMVGKTKMKDWKASVRYWERNEKKFSAAPTGRRELMDYSYKGDSL